MYRVVFISRKTPLKHIHSRRATMGTYTTLLIPPYSFLPANTLTLLAQKLRDFKLHALLSDPKAFSQSHATESQLPCTAWEARVSNPEFRIVVCVVDSDERNRLGLNEEEGNGGEKENRTEEVVERLLDSAWAGTFTLVGPVARDDWVFQMSGQPIPGVDEEEKRWHLTSLFVLPEHRGRGLAAKLTLAAVQAGSSISQKSPPPVSGSQAGRLTMRFRLIVHPNNKAVIGLYKKLGFVEGGLYTQKEAMVAMGDEAGVPEDAEGERWNSRLAIGMERMV
jgi:ribosomal protein S18 acetylase RimI-like enzyme